MYQYLMEASICLAGFYIVYRLFLANDTFYRRNRIYLLASLLLSLVLPLLDFSISPVSRNVMNQFVWNSSDWIEPLGASVAPKQAEPSSFRLWSLLPLVYLLGMGWAVLSLFTQVLKLIKTYKAYEKKNLAGLKLVLTDSDSSPYSFFNCVFLNLQNQTDSEKRKILSHEAVHAKQLHSLDLIVVEILRILFWFHPFIYLYHKALIATHEYLADQACIRQGICKIDYQQSLVQNVEKQMMLALTSGFTSSLTLKRIKMIKKIKTPKIAQLKVLLVLPVLFLLLMSFSTEKQALFLSSGEHFPDEVLEKTSKAKTRFTLPVQTVKGVWMSSGYGMRVHPITKKKKLHRGTDIAGPKGTHILATADGTVRKVRKAIEKKGYGNLVIIDHANGFSSLYAQLDSFSVKEGQKVKKGELIAYMGSSGLSTGPHLHFELKKDGEVVDPAQYIDLKKIPTHK